MGKNQKAESNYTFSERVKAHKKELLILGGIAIAGVVRII